ncbi:MAG TPA: maleylpyruvate isomerase N-terminal domain-containing protein [Microthrixaceae bacterium]|nr:maleylpyruvate isomerase N-terminal domain-containing protein [Microthrixaceae bacterium]
MNEDNEVLTTFLDGSHSVLSALRDPVVEATWNQRSVLEDQSVGGLASHLARGVWIVDDYLNLGVPRSEIDFTSAGQYFAELVSSASPEDHQAIRDRGAAVASSGHGALLVELSTRLDTLSHRLLTLPPETPIAVAAGKVIRLVNYLETRIVEQVIHLDDLARSTGHEPWQYPTAGTNLAVTIGMDIALRRSGSASVLRGIYRSGFSEAVFPVM